MTPLRRIGALSAAFVGSDVARAGIAFGMSLILGRSLGVDGFGRWLFCTTWASTLTVVSDLGFGVLLTRDASRSQTDVGRLLGSALTIRMALLGPVAAVVYAASGSLARDAESIAGLRVAVALALIGAAYGCLASLLRARPRWLPTVLGLETTCLGGQLLASWWTARHGGDVPSLLAVATLTQAVQILAAIALWPFVFGCRVRATIPSFRDAADLVRRALPFAASGMVANLQTRLGPMMLGYLSTQAELGWFGAASRFGSLARLVPHAVFSAALPLLSNDFDRDPLAARHSSQAFGRALATLIFLTAVPCIALAGPLLRLAFGAAFVNATPALVWTGVALVPTLVNSGSKIWLYASGREAVAVRWGAAALAVQLAAGLVLIPQFGAAGAAMSLTMGEASVWWPLRRARVQRVASAVQVAWTTSS